MPEPPERRRTYGTSSSERFWHCGWIHGEMDELFLGGPLEGVFKSWRSACVCKRCDRFSARFDGRRGPVLPVTWERRCTLRTPSSQGAGREPGTGSGDQGRGPG